MSAFPEAFVLEEHHTEPCNPRESIWTSRRRALTIHVPLDRHRGAIQRCHWLGIEP
jgi:hypothetical protein